MKKLAMALVTLALGCVGPIEPIPPVTSVVCDAAGSAAEECEQGTGSITLEVWVVTVTRVP
jgi:hypothetical protein